MKKRKWLGMMELADEEYVTEADPTKKAASKKKLWLRFGMLAACFALMLSVGGVWFALKNDTPSDDPVNPNESDPPISDPLLQYADSEYYDIIRKLDAWRVKTLQQGPVDSLGGGDSYAETTDNQVSGVIEADTIKRSSQYVYYLNMEQKMLEIYSIDGEASVQVGSYEVISKEAFLNCADFYLSEDCKTVTLIYFDYDSGCTCVDSLDVSNPASIQKKSTVKVGGFYQTSRMIDGTLLLLTSLNVSAYQMDFNKLDTFVPRIEVNHQMNYFLPEDIVSHSTVEKGQYTIAVQFTEEGLELQGQKAFLSYSGQFYVTRDTLYMMYLDSENQTQTTEIMGVGLQNGLEKCGSVRVAGSVKDQYSMDVHDEILRVVTTTDVVEEKTTSASLYCVDLNTWSVIASVKNFAPLGESVRSVRFDGFNAYVCTAVQQTDPVFFFDLSDLNHITYKDTGTIPGFSMSLVNFENGNLLGIGFDEAWNLKIEMYRECEQGVDSVSTYIREGVDFPRYYKSYYIDRENQLIGMGFFDGTQEEQENRPRYLLLHFDGENFNVLLDEQLDGLSDAKRGFYFDGYFYLFGESDFAVHAISVE